MALQLDTIYRGIPVQGAYCQVGDVSISYSKNQMAFLLLYKATTDSEAFTAVHCAGPYVLDGGNPFEQAYNHLKMLPEFTGAVDC